MDNIKFNKKVYREKQMLKGIPLESQHYVYNIVFDFINKILYNSSPANNNYPTPKMTWGGLIIENRVHDTS